MLKVFLILFLLHALPVYTQGPSKTAPNKKGFWLKDQDDQTDTLAIPLDSSEEEERLEQEKLDKIQKQEEQKKIPPANK